jgi:LysR family cys regulon transcriptional activator
MRLQQLRYIHEIVRNGLSISEAAAVLHTSQPGISKQVRLLEDELGVVIFARNRNRLTEVTPAGLEILALAQRMLENAESLRRVGKEHGREDRGTLTVATTHTQARYALPRVIKRFIARYPDVRLSVRQGTPSEIWDLVANGDVDIAIASEPGAPVPDLAMYKCYDLPRIVLTLPRHPLLKTRHLTLDALVCYPLITYDDKFIGRSKVHRAFGARGLTPNLVLSATDSDVIKAYVELGLGVAIVANMAFDARRDRNLRAIDASHLFDSNTVYLGFRRGSYLRGYALDFIEMAVPHLNRKTLLAAAGGPTVSALAGSPR